MKRILILQSCSPAAPHWVWSCMSSVEMWAEHHGYGYIRTGDDLFSYAPQFQVPFTRVTRSDICRLYFIRDYLARGRYDAVYWLDSDFLIWNRYEFDLPMPELGAVVCARETFVTHDLRMVPLVNNSVLGLSSLTDVDALIERSEAMLNSRLSSIVPPRMTLIGTDLFSAGGFPLRQIYAKQAGCFSSHTIDTILGPYDPGRRHLWRLSLANGATLRGANLCSSRENSSRRMDDLVVDLLHGEDWELGWRAHLSPLYRTWLRAINLPDRIRCWSLTRFRRLRKSLSTASGKA